MWMGRMGTGRRSGINGAERLDIWRRLDTMSMRDPCTSRTIHDLPSIYQRHDLVVNNTESPRGENRVSDVEGSCSPSTTSWKSQPMSTTLCGGRAMSSSWAKSLQDLVEHENHVPPGSPSLRMLSTAKSNEDGFGMEIIQARSRIFRVEPRPGSPEQHHENFQESELPAD